MHIHARTLTVKVSCVQMLETEITTDISWDKEASGALAYKYSVAVFCMQKQYDLEHIPIIEKGIDGDMDVFIEIPIAANDGYDDCCDTF